MGGWSLKSCKKTQKWNFFGPRFCFTYLSSFEPFSVSFEQNPEKFSLGQGGVLHKSPPEGGIGLWASGGGNPSPPPVPMYDCWMIVFGYPTLFQNLMFDSN